MFFFPPSEAKIVIEIRRLWLRETSEWIFMNAAVLERGQKGGLAGRRRQGKGRQTDTDRASDRQMDKHGKVIDSWSGGESSRSVCSVCWSGFKTYTLHSPCPSIYPQSPSVCSPFCLLYFSPRAASCSSRHGDIRFLKTAPTWLSAATGGPFIPHSAHIPKKFFAGCIMRLIEHVAVSSHFPSCPCNDASGRISQSEWAERHSSMYDDLQSRWENLVIFWP